MKISQISKNNAKWRAKPSERPDGFHAILYREIPAEDISFAGRVEQGETRRPSEYVVGLTLIGPP